MICTYRNKSVFSKFRNKTKGLDVSIYSETDLEEYFEMRPKGKSDVFGKLVRRNLELPPPLPHH